MPDYEVKSAAGLTVLETLDAGPFTQEDAKYREPSDSAWNACGACRFFVRQPGSDVGTCEAVDGPIAWFGTCVYYINTQDAVYEGFARRAEQFAGPVFMQVAPLEKKIVKEGDKFCVYTADGSKNLGCHDTHEEAVAHLAAVESNKIKHPIVTKNKDGSETRFCPIIKVNEEERFIYGIVYEPDIADAHDEYARKATIRKAAHGFLAEFGEVNLMHTIPLAKRQVSIVESFIAPVSFEVNGDYISKGAWVLAAVVHDDEIWELIKTGELTGWSLEGHAEYGEEVERIQPEG